VVTVQRFFPMRGEHQGGQEAVTGSHAAFLFSLTARTGCTGRESAVLSGIRRFCQKLPQRVFEKETVVLQIWIS
jgi:hypothetical protein